MTALATEGNKLISAAKDGKVAIISIGTGGNFKLEKSIDLTGISANNRYKGTSFELNV